MDAERLCSYIACYYSWTQFSYSTYNHFTALSLPQVSVGTKEAQKLIDSLVEAVYATDGTETVQSKENLQVIDRALALLARSSQDVASGMVHEDNNNYIHD